MKSPFATKHKFERKEVPYGEKTIDEVCEICGAIRVRYKSGSVAYRTEKGTVTPFSRECKAGSSPKSSVTLTTTPTIENLKPIKANETSGRAFLPTLQHLTDNEARLKESIVLIRLMFEDMIKNDVVTKSREMAGRFLYSNGYAEMVKHLNRTA